MTDPNAHKPKETILQEAQRLIFGARSEAYGHPLDNFTTIAQMWTAYLTRKHAFTAADLLISAEDVALMMTLLKVAREAFKEQRDNSLDAAGYLGCYERVQDERERRCAEAELPSWDAVPLVVPDAPHDPPELSILDVLNELPTSQREDTPVIRERRVDSPPPHLMGSTFSEERRAAKCQPPVNAPYHSYKCDCPDCSRRRVVFPPKVDDTKDFTGEEKRG